MAIQIPSQKPLVVRLVDSEEAFHALKDRWNELSDASVYPNIFSTWQWCSIWWKWYGEKELHGKLFLVLIESDDQLVGLFPLYLSTKGISGINRTRTLHFIGYGARPSGEYWGPIIRKDWVEPVCDAALDFFHKPKADWDSFFFESYALDDPGTVAFTQKMKVAFPSYSQEDEERFYITFSGTYDDYLKTLSGHNRSKKKNRYNQAIKKNGATFCTMELDTIDKWFPVMKDLLKESRRRLNQVSPYETDKYCDFQIELLNALLPLQHADVSLLNYEGHPVAVTYSFLYCGKCFFYQPGYASNIQGSPGDVSLQMLLMKMIDLGCTEFDFLRGGEWYKSQYTDVGRKTEMLVLFPKRNKSYFLTLFAHYFYKPLRRSAKRILLLLFEFFNKKEAQELRERKSSDDSQEKVEV